MEVSTSSTVCGLFSSSERHVNLYHLDLILHLQGQLSQYVVLQCLCLCLMWWYMQVSHLSCTLMCKKCYIVSLKYRWAFSCDCSCVNCCAEGTFSTSVVLSPCLDQLSQSGFSCIPRECWETGNVSSWYWHHHYCRLLCSRCQKQCFSQHQVSCIGFVL